MRFSEAWLREWVDPPIATAELVEQLSMAGLEVDTQDPAAPPFSGVLIGKVTSYQRHPDADKLSVCEVDVGGAETLPIVCGASNVAAGMKVPVATVGAILPGDFKIKKAKLRGVQSLGMICSTAELGLSESSSGIMVLADDAPLGSNVRDYLKLDDTCIEVDLTPDRGDCLSLAGIAREVGVINRLPVNAPSEQPVNPQTDARFAVRVDAPQACPRYACRIIRGIDDRAETPRWLAEKLRRSGIRAISPVVDVTNFVMLELGQPMHAFDLATLDGEIQVRLASKDERLQLLDGSEIELGPGSLVIADKTKPLALAGIMGGAASAVTAATRDILLESAFFAPLAIAGKARSYGLHTDSSHRFERGVDPQLQTRALERATSLLLDIVGGEPGPIVEAVSDADLPVRPTIGLRRVRIAKVLGVEIADTEVEDILKRLGMVVGETEDGWAATPPSARFDLAIEVDLIEELGRIYGYAQIPESNNAAPIAMVAKPESGLSLESMRRTLIERDYFEAITYSFVSPRLAEIFGGGADLIRLDNPISADMSVMRPSLWPGLISALTYNLARQQERVRLFESGLAFQRVADGLSQTAQLAGAVCGSVGEQQWGEPARPVDFFDVKADVECLLAPAFANGACRFQAAEYPVLHPGQTAHVWLDNRAVGWLGMLHPAVSRQLEVGVDVFVFELVLTELLQGGRLPRFRPVSKFPTIRRDLSFVVGRDVSYGRILESVRDAAPTIVQDVRLFDVYTGEKIDSDLKSMALGLILQDSSHTLTDQEVDRAAKQIVAALTTDLGAKLRD